MTTTIKQRITIKKTNAHAQKSCHSCFVVVPLFEMPISLIRAIRMSPSGFFLNTIII